MTRLVYTDLTLPWTLSSTTYPTITQAAADITSMYMQASAVLCVAYSATVPDTDLIRSVIKFKLEQYYIAMNEMRKNPSQSRPVPPPMIFSRDEITMAEKEKGTIFKYTKTGY